MLARWVLAAGSGSGRRECHVCVRVWVGLAACDVYALARLPAS